MSWKTEPNTMNSGMLHSQYILQRCVQFEEDYDAGLLYQCAKDLLSIYRISHAWYIKRASTKGVTCSVCSHKLDDNNKRLHEQIISLIGKTARPIKNHQDASNIAIELDNVMNMIHVELKKASLINVESKYTEMGEHVATGR